MDLQFSEEDRQFRASAREWLGANVPREPHPGYGPAGARYDRDWQRKLYELSLIHI